MWGGEDQFCIHSIYLKASAEIKKERCTTAILSARHYCNVDGQLDADDTTGKRTTGGKYGCIRLWRRDVGRGTALFCMHLVSTFYMSERNSVAKNKHSDLLAADLPCTRTSLNTVSMAGGGGRIL